MTTYQYKVNEQVFECSGLTKEDVPEDFFYNHDGWEATWPILFEIWKVNSLDQKEYLGKFSVELETVPSFYFSHLS